MKNFLLLLSLLFFFQACTQVAKLELDCETEFFRFVDAQESEFAHEENSPLKDKDRERFESINYFPYNSEYCVMAKWLRTQGEPIFEMATSSERLPQYVKYGELHFEIMGEKLVLSAYQSIDLREEEEYANYLFVPFNDLSNGVESYGGGRYMDLEIPQSDSIRINLNMTYHPYCAYNEKYSCPIPPEENMLDISIQAGVRLGLNGGQGKEH